MPKVVYTRQLREHALAQVQEYLGQGRTLAHAIDDTAFSLGLNAKTLSEYWRTHKRQQWGPMEPRVGLYIELSAQEKRNWIRAAETARMPVSDWIRVAVNLQLSPWERYRYEREGDGEQ